MHVQPAFDIIPKKQDKCNDSRNFKVILPIEGTQVSVNNNSDDYYMGWVCSMCIIVAAS